MTNGQVLAIGAVIFLVAFVACMVNKEGQRIRREMALMEAKGAIEIDLGVESGDLEGFSVVCEGYYVKHHTFEHLLDAIEWVESRGDANAIGQDGEVGAYQLKEIYVDDVNRILQLNGETIRIDYKDRLSPVGSRKITAVVICHYANNDWAYKSHTQMQYYETAARSHNSPANRNNSKTDAYWQKIKARMEEVHPDYLWKE